MFSTSDKVITIIYHSDDHIGREVLSYAQTKEIPVRDIDIAKTKVSESSWAEFADKMGIPIKGLINTQHPNFQQHHDEDIDLSDHDWLKFLEHNTATLRAPIVMKGEKIQMMADPQDMLRFN